MFFVIEGRLPSLNEYLSACNRSYYVGGKMKRQTDEMIGWFILSALQKKTLQPINSPITLRFTWHEKNKRRDPDNIVSAKKFILDALQKQGVIPNDSRAYIKGFTDEIVDSKKDYIEVEITSVQTLTEDIEA